MNELRRSPLGPLSGRTAIGMVLISTALVGCHKKHQIFEDNRQILEHAQQLIAKRHLIEAVQALGDIGLYSPVAPELDPHVKLSLADAYYYQGGTVNIVEAQGRYEQFLSFYPLHALAPYARFQIGNCLYAQAAGASNDQEFSQRALDHFQAMVKDLPNSSPYRVAAKAMALKAQDKLSEHEWIVSSFYFKGDHFAGAAQRLTALLDKYPGSKRRAECYLLLADAYQKLGQVDQERATLKKMVGEFPAGQASERAQKRLAELG